MKKLLLMMLVLLGGVMQASAADMYLRAGGLKNASWTDNLAAYKFSLNWDGSQDVYEFTIGSDKLQDGTDFYFRLYRDATDSQFETCPYQNKNYTIQWKGDNNTYNGRWEQYSATSGSDFQGTSGAFHVEHSTIKACEYKITVYLKYDSPWKYYIKVEIIDMPVTVSNLGYSTFSCDRALDLDNISTGLTAYKASSVTDGKVVLTKATGKVAASTGLLLAGTKGTVTTGTIPVVTISEGTDISSTNLLKATVSETEVAASTTNKYHYFLAGNAPENVGFYNLATAATSGAGKAYLETTTALSNAGTNSRAAWIFEDTTTGIANVDVNSKFDANAPMYNLAGQRVSKSYKGVVIVNGKKMLNK